MRRGVAVLLLVGAFLATGSSCLAKGRDLLVWAPFNPSSAESAAAVMEEFARWVETAAGWPADSMQVLYENTIDGGLEALDESSPGFLMVPMPVFLGYHEDRNWQAVLSMLVTSVDAERFTLLGPPGASFDSVNKPVIGGSPAYNEQFVRALVLGEHSDLEVSAFRPTPNSLALIRRVAEGESALALVDEGQRRALESMPDLMEKLVPLAESPLMPMALVVQGPAATKKDAKGLVRALGRLETDEQAEELRKTMQIRRFEPVDEELLQELIKTYAAAGGTKALEKSQEAGK